MYISAYTILRSTRVTIFSLYLFRIFVGLYFLYDECLIISVRTVVWRILFYTAGFLLPTYRIFTTVFLGSSILRVLYIENFYFRFISHLIFISFIKICLFSTILGIWCLDIIFFIISFKKCKINFFV